MDAFKIFSPEQLYDLSWTEIVVMRGRTGGGTDTAIQTTIQLVVVAQISLDILEDFFEFLAPDWPGAN